jgi:hypothetical protein
MLALQIFLVALILASLAVYVLRLRTIALDIIVPLCFGFAVLLVLQPAVASSLAHLAGINRGLDLIVSLAIPVLGLLILLLFVRTRELNLKLTAAIRELSIVQAHITPKGDTSRN